MLYRLAVTPRGMIFHESRNERPCIFPAAWVINIFVRLKEKVCRFVEEARRGGKGE